MDNFWLTYEKTYEVLDFLMLLWTDKVEMIICRLCVSTV